MTYRFIFIWVYRIIYSSWICSSKLCDLLFSMVYMQAYLLPVSRNWGHHCWLWPQSSTISDGPRTPSDNCPLVDIILPYFILPSMKVTNVDCKMNLHGSEIWNWVWRFDLLLQVLITHWRLPVAWPRYWRKDLVVDGGQLVSLVPIHGGA